MGLKNRSLPGRVESGGAEFVAEEIEGGGEAFFEGVGGFPAGGEEAFGAGAGVADIAGAFGAVEDFGGG